MSGWRTPRTLPQAWATGTPSSTCARALADLPPRERACTVLRFYDDLTVSQIAAQLGLADGTVKRYLADASARLAEVLGGGFNDDRIPVVTHSRKEGR